jgi:Glycoside Hydrolase Family 113
MLPAMLHPKVRRSRWCKTPMFAAAVALLVSGSPAGRSAAPAPPSEAAGLGQIPERFRGVCWEGSGPVGIDDLRPVHQLGADWISQTPFGWSRAVDSPEVRLATRRVLWGESDSGLVATTNLARSLGLRTLLKPHLWVGHGQWTGDVEMSSEADWRTWFDNYEVWLLHYSRLAAEQGIEALAIGTELGGTTARTADWRRIIAHVRAVYPGRLTYCANWSDEAERIQFWDALDFIGVQAYYPLSQSDHPSLEEVRASWQSIAARLEKLARRTGKPVVFTEVGYKSMVGGLRQPWKWETDGEPDVIQQRDAYAALFETLWSRPWFAGTFVWKWHPHLRTQTGRAARDFTPQGKPALEVIRAWYTTADPLESSSGGVSGSHGQRPAAAGR